MSLAHYLRDLLTLHNLIGLGKYIVFFLVGIFVGEPIKRWKRGRRSLREKRKRLYTAIAEIFNEVVPYPAFKDPQQVLPQLREYCQRLDPGKHKSVLEMIRGSRASMPADAQGFERIMQLLVNLSNVAKSTSDPFALNQATSDFVDEFLETLEAASFDQKLLLAAMAADNRAKLQFTIRQARVITNKIIAIVEESPVQKYDSDGKD
jgi:hypothetical protein